MTVSLCVGRGVLLAPKNLVIVFVWSWTKRSSIVEVPWSLYVCNFSGAKIHQSSGKTRCIEQGGVNYTLEDHSKIPESIASCHEHAMEALKRCRDIESVMTGLEKQSSNGTYFPVTVCRRPPSSPQPQQRHWTNKSSKSDRRKRRSGSTGDQSPSSISTMCQTSPSVLHLSENMQVYYANHTTAFCW